MAQPGRIGHHLIRNAGQHCNERRYVSFRIHQGLKLTQHLTAAYFDSADLSDRVRLGAASGFKIDNAERHLG